MWPWFIVLPKTGKRFRELNICKKRMSKLEKKAHAFIVGKSHLSWAFLIYKVAPEQDTGADPFPHSTGKIPVDLAPMQYLYPRIT